MKSDNLIHFNTATLEKLVVSLLITQVNDMRQAGLTDRAIARKMKLPRWIIRAIE